MIQPRTEGVCANTSVADVSSKPLGISNVASKQVSCLLTDHQDKILVIAGKCALPRISRAGKWSARKNHTILHEPIVLNDCRVVARQNVLYPKIKCLSTGAWINTSLRLVKDKIFSFFAFIASNPYQRHYHSQ